MPRIPATFLLQTFLAAAFIMLMLHSSSLAAETPSDLAELEQQALRSATQTVAPSVVQIRTVGGLERIGRTLLSQGPTTGLIITADGYIVSSAFNFANQPTSILVRLSDGQQLAAELVARDKNRMLVLLKVNPDKPLPVPKLAPSADFRVGQWAVALGRTFQAKQVGVSVGIISALNRMYGRVLQTDASVSVANYGGPLVDIRGRVLGVLVPMSPQSGGGSNEQSELAGAEFYDSGIGFAVPLEHILDILDRWKQGSDLLPGKLGIGLLSGDVHTTKPAITSVWPNSPAAQADWKAGDLITAVDGKPVTTQSQLHFQTTPHYAGDALSITFKRGEEELQTEITLTGELDPYQHAFLGVLPNRFPPTDKKPTGVLLRGVWPDSPAAAAGIAAGDKIIKFDETDITTTAILRSAFAATHPTEIVEITVQRDDEELVRRAKLTTQPDEILSAADLTRNAEPPAAKGDDAEATKFQELKLPQFPQQAVYYAPQTEKDIASGLLFWLGDGDQQNNQAVVDTWQNICRRDHLTLLIASPAEKGVWKSDDLQYLTQLARVAPQRLRADRHRLVVAGQGKSGQLAYALAFRNRSPFNGVIAIDSPLPRTLKLPAVTPTKQLSVLSVVAQNSSFAPLIRRDLKLLDETGYTTSWIQRPPTNETLKPINDQIRDQLARWIDGLDRI